MCPRAKRQNKFGIPYDEVPNLLRWAASLPHIVVQGVHSHIGSQITKPETFARAARALVDLVHEVRRAGLTITDLDFGGGFGVQYRGFMTHPQLPPRIRKKRTSPPPHSSLRSSPF